jgi:protein TonB
MAAPIPLSLPAAPEPAPACGVPRPRVPPLPSAASDALTPTQRRLMLAGIAAAHMAAVYGLLQVHEVRDAVREAAPLFVDFIAPPTPPEPPAPPPPPPRPQPALKKPPPPAPVIAAAPSPAPAPFIVPAPPPEVAPPEPAPPAPVVIAMPPAPPAPAPLPKMIPASAVQYLEPPVLEYPRLSRRNGESGQVLVRVWIDTAGLPRTVQVSRSSGHPRLDEAGMAAVQKARFKPYTENGQPMAGWAVIPLNFELER